MGLLSKINDPKDLRKLQQEQLSTVATEVREYIVDVVSKNGGHLAPSLGVVDLSIALHYVFDTPHDKIVWDVGHQCYAHKILTGRREAFKTIRQHKGLSGFTKRSESEYDPFGAGHSSTSISAALGIAKAFKKRGLQNRAIAVIGDGSMTGGLALEGLNQAGNKTGNLIVVLNDNEMSISKNVGALSLFLSTHLHSKRATSIRRWFKRTLTKLMPKSGKTVYDIARRAEEAAAGFFTPGFMFEAFGFHYIGPIDGHNLPELVRIFNEIKDIPIGETPLLVHVITKKGFGYKPAEENPTKFHGVAPFNKETGAVGKANGHPSFTSVVGATLTEIAKKDSSVIGITAAMPTGTGLDQLQKELPEQFYDVGIAEGHAVTMAAGLATEGFKPVFAVYSTFLQRAFDNVIHDVCLQNLPVTFALDRAGLVGDDGPTHHGVFDISYLRQAPNMIVMAPRDENILRHMLYTAINSGKPCAIRYPRGNGIGVPLDKNLKEVPLGSSELMFGNYDADVAVFALGTTVWSAIDAAKQLAKKHISVCVIDARFAKPLCETTFSVLAAKTKKWITIEENILSGGFGSGVSEWLIAKGHNDISLKILALPDVFVEQGPLDLLRSKYKIDSAAIVEAAQNLCTKETKSAKSEDFLSKGSSSLPPTEISAQESARIKS